MAGNLLISQALLLLVALNGVISMRTTSQYRVPHLYQANGESSEEERSAIELHHNKYNSDTQDGYNRATQYPTMGPLRASDFKEKYTLYNGDGRPYDFYYDTFELSKARLEFKSGAPLKILIHGFLNNGRSAFPTNVRDAYLKRIEEHKNQYNVIVYDWGDGACASLTGWRSFMRPYNNAAENVEVAGVRLGDMLVKFQKLGIANVSTEVHLIGHSLGSHVAGHAGRQVYKDLDSLVHRVSALDPAGPFFWKDRMFLTQQDPFSRLNRNRFHFLDVYHTSKDYGSEQKIGNVDFFINGGLSQESCKIEYTVPLFGFKIPIFVFDKILQVCSHNFATHIFAKSINDKTMKACTGCYSYKEYLNGQCKCEDELIMGEFADEEKLEGYHLTYGTAYIATKKDTTVGSNYLEILKNSKWDIDLFLNAFKSVCFFNFLDN